MAGEGEATLRVSALALEAVEDALARLQAALAALRPGSPGAPGSSSSETPRKEPVSVSELWSGSEPGDADSRFDIFQDFQKVEDSHKEVQFSLLVSEGEAADSGPVVAEESAPEPRTVRVQEPERGSMRSQRSQQMLLALQASMKKHHSKDLEDGETAEPSRSLVSLGESRVLRRSRARVMLRNVRARDFLTTDTPNEQFTLQNALEVDVGSLSLGRETTFSEAITRRDRCILDPYSKAYSIHAFACLVLITYDVIFVPVLLAWNLGVGDSWVPVQLFIALFWAVDILITFNAGIFVAGQMVVSRKAIARRYLRTWFLLDATVVIVDLVSLSIGSLKTKGSALIRVVKIMRLLRLFRSVHLSKFSEAAFQGVTEVLGSSSAALLLSVAKPLGIIVVVNHWLACLWFAVGQFAPSDTGRHWTDDPEFQTNVVYQYTTSLHWSLTQMTPGSMQVFPENSAERIANLLCLLVGMVTFTSLISSLSAKTTEHLRVTAGRSQQLRLLSSFLEGNHVKRTVAVAIEKRFLEVMRKENKPLVQSDVAALSHLPSSLQRSLKLELCRQQMGAVLFRLWNAVDPAGFCSLCMDAVEARSFATDDIVFSSYAPGNELLVVSQGRLTYEVEHEEPLVLQVGAQLSEVALWVKWLHFGTATAAMGSVVLFIDAEQFGTMALSHKCFGYVARDLGWACHRWACLDTTCLSDVVSVHGSGSSMRASSSVDRFLSAVSPERVDLGVSLLEVLLPAMSLESRLLLANVAAQLDAHSSDSFEDQEGIDEVVQGSALYVMNARDELVRLVSVQVVALQDDRGCTLTRVATAKAGAFHVKVRVPGSKQRAGEPAAEVVSRVLSKLAGLAEDIVWVRTEVDVSLQTSKSKKIQTKYIRTSNVCRLSKDCTLKEAVFTKKTEMPDFTTKRTSNVSRNHPSPESLQMLMIPQSGRAVDLYAWLDGPSLEFYESAAGELALASFFDELRLELPLGLAAGGHSGFEFATNTFSEEELATI